MNHYQLLLEEFHGYEKEKSQSKEFLQIIDELRTHKKTKTSTLYRKHQELAKLESSSLQNNQNTSSIALNGHFSSTNRSLSENDIKIENQISNTELKKQIMELEKSLLHSKTSISEIQSQLNVFSKKDNEIKQLYYSSKRNLQVANNKLKVEKQLFHEQQAKNIKLLEHLQTQKKNLQHELRYMAEQLAKEKNKNKEKSIDSLLNGALMQLCFDGQALRKNQYSSRSQARKKSIIKIKSRVSNLQVSRTSTCSQDYENKYPKFGQKHKFIQQIYSKTGLEETLSYLLIITRMKKLWEREQKEEDLQNKGELYNQLIKSNEEAHIKFRFMSKTQIFEYYQRNGLEIKPEKFISFYYTINSSINRSEKVSGQLNETLKNLKIQYQILCNILGDLVSNKDKSSYLFIKQRQKQIDEAVKIIERQCQSIFHMLFAEYWVIDKVQRVYRVVEGIRGRLQPKNAKTFANFTEVNKEDKKVKGHLSNTLSAFEKVFSNISKRRSSVVSNEDKNKSLSKKSSIQQLFPQIKQFSEVLLKCVYQRPGFLTPEDTQENQQINLLRQWIWEKMSNNLIFRLFGHLRKYRQNISRFSFSSEKKDKQFSAESLLTYFENQTMMDYEKLHKLIGSFRTCYCHYFVTVQNQNQQIKQNIEQRMIEQQSQLNLEMKASDYHIESRQYFRRDNYKLLEKLERIEQKKKGLFIPYKFGVDIDHQLINTSTKTKRNNNDNKGKQLPLKEIQNRNRYNGCASTRTMRNSSTNNHIYISQYRERINKADKKIRNLLRAAQQMKIQTNDHAFNDRAKSATRFRLSVKNLRTPRGSVPEKQLISYN